jgi:4-hydroxy-4-methyl-2-oxoglutarate aldolase
VGPARHKEDLLASHAHEGDRQPVTATQDPDRTRDPALLERLGALHVAVVSDCLDKIGLRDQVMAQRIRALTPESRLAGYAATVHLVTVDRPPEDPKDAYRGEIEALECLAPGDVMVVSTCPGAYWGELLATASRHLGAVGVVADAYTRDTATLVEMAFPTFVAGISALDSLGRTDVDVHDVPIECGGVPVDPGDLVLADRDGVVVIPRHCAESVVSAAEAKVEAERDMRADLRRGMPMSEAFATYGIL